MNRKTKKRAVSKPAQNFDYAATFDRLMSEQFDEIFTTGWNICAGAFGGYVTLRENGKPLTKQQALYGRGLSNGMAAYRDYSL